MALRQVERIQWMSRPVAFLRSVWRHREFRDSLAVILFALAIYVWANLADVPPRLFRFGMDHAQWEVDDAIVVVSASCIALAVFAWRRMRDLNAEVKARRAAESAVQRLTLHDPLTGLPNRSFFNEKLEEILRDIAARGRHAAVLMLNLSGFKSINDVHGHLIGDKVLVEFARRVSLTAKGALVARLGGDEFAIILPKIGSPDEPAALANRIAAAIAEPFTVAGSETALGVSIGIAVAPDDAATADDLVRRAHLALSRAKKDDRSATRFFEPAMDAHVERRSAIERELRAAIAADGIEVYYQPLVSLSANRIVGFEALARWTSTALGPVTPDTFIAIAEETGLIHRLGDHLLRIACRDATAWPGDMTLAFNISPLQLRDETLGLRVLGILGETGLPPARLELEITESAIVGDSELAKRTIDQLRTAGVRVALDDFGTGYATMSQLLSFRFDKIKIDRSFVANLGNDADSEVIVRAIVGLANGLGLATTAEGIETAIQLAALNAIGCREGQGYLFGKAVPASQVAELLRMPSIAAA